MATGRAALDQDEKEEILFLSEEPLDQSLMRATLHRVYSGEGRRLQQQELVSWESLRYTSVSGRSFLSGEFDADSRRDVVLWTSGAAVGHGYVERIDLFTQQDDGMLVFAGGQDVDRCRWPVAGDFDGDGRTELACAGPAAGLLVYGYDEGEGWVLRQTLDLPRLTGLTAADLDADGDDDLVAKPANSLNTITLLLGDPSAPLQFVHSESLDLERVGTPRALQLDGEGALELFVFGVAFRGERVITFLALNTFPTGFDEISRQPRPQPSSTYARVIDLHGDGFDDLLFRPGNPGGFFLLINHGKMPLVEGQRSRSSTGLVGVLDVDGDAVEDFIVYGGNGLLWYPGRPGDRFEEPYVYTQLMRRGYRLQSDDLNDDGLADLMVHGNVLGPLTDPVLSWIDIYFGCGDGTFEFERSEDFSGVLNEIRVGDLDQDGLTDLLRTKWGQDAEIVKVAYGLAEGAFEPWVAWKVNSGVHSLRLGQLDGDPGLEILTQARTQISPNVLGLEHEFTRIEISGRQWDVGKTAFSLDEWRTIPAELSDLDSDGLDDVLLSHARGFEPPWAVSWRKTKPGGGFGPQIELHRWEQGRAIERVVPCDLDLDGSLDLLVQIRTDTYLNRVLKRVGPGLFRSGPVSGQLAQYAFDEPVDLDGDGVLDLFSGRRGLYRRGDGTGGFASEGPAWRIGAIRADFNGDGLLDTLGESLVGVEVALGVGRALAKDAGVPKLELSLQPVINEDQTPVEFDSTWHLIERAEDECDTWPEMVLNRLDLGTAAPDESAFRKGEGEEIRLHGVAGSAPSLVLLVGAEEEPLRRRWDAVQVLGGFELTRNPMLRLVLLDRDGGTASAWGDGDIVSPQLRLLGRYTFDERGLILAAAYGANQDITFTVAVADRAGHRVEREISFREAHGSYCASSGALPEICR